MKTTRIRRKAAHTREEGFASLDEMDEARTVMSRLERIERLQEEKAPAAALLAEVRQLLREGEAWIAAEGGAAGANDALERCRGRFESRRGAPTERDRALL